ncbi:12-oxophytodienoate reductase, partial [Globisporangium polare]
APYSVYWDFQKGADGYIDFPAYSELPSK